MAKTDENLSRLSQKATVRTLAREHGVTTRTIQRWARSGKIATPAPDTSPRERRRKSNRAWYVCVFFAHNGPGPYACFHCKQPVTMDEVEVHHADHDHENNDPANLLPAHVRCHMTYHNAKRYT